MANPKPSHAGRWVYCPGSVALQERYPDQRDNSDALDGISAHHRAACLLDNKPVVPTTLPEDYIDAVDLYVDHVSQVTAGRARYVEYPVTAFNIHQKCNGRLDSAWYDSAADVLHIWDFKTGRSFTDAFENWAMLCYAIGLTAQINFGRAKLWIVQPRCFHGDPIRSWTVTRDELRRYSETLHVAAHKSQEPNAPTCSGPHCAWCSALINCPSSNAATGHAIDVAGSSDGAVALTPVQLGTRYAVLCRAKEIIDHMAKAAEASIIQIIKRGEQVPGWEISQAAGRLKWLAGKEAEAKAMALLCGVDITKEDFITPTQAIAAGIPAEVVGMYAARSGGGTSLKPVNYNKFTLVKEIFNEAR
jgi:hypothetical protein